MQEHWLFSFEKSKLTDCGLENGFNSHVKCCDEFEPISAKQRTRGWGGCAILWKNYLDPFIEKVTDGSERICVILLHSLVKTLCIIAVYMPTSGGTSSNNIYREHLDEINEIVQKYHYCDIILIGDMNASFNRSKQTTRDRIFINGMKEIGFKLPENYPSDNTFHHNNGTSESQIDYILPFNDRDLLENIKVAQRESLNTSTHDLVMAELSVALGEIHKQTLSQSQKSEKLNWSKCDIQTFQNLVTDQCMKEELFSPCDVETKLEKLTTILNDCSKEAVGTVKRKSKMKPKIWTPEIKNLCKISKQYHWEWKTSGSLKCKTNPLWIRCITAKRNLRRAQRQEDAKQRYMLYAEIMNTGSSNEKLFYKLINNQRRGKTAKLKQLTVNGNVLENTDEIANGWATYFEHLSKRLESSRFDEKYKLFVEADIEEIRKLCLADKQSDELISIENLSEIIGQLKPGKSPDEYSLMAEHLKFGGPSVIYILKHIFDSIYTSGDIPSIFKSGLITPIYKRQDKPLEDPNSYRRITVSSIIGKLFEKVLLHKIRPILNEQQNELQRGFTKNVSPTNAALLLSEAIAEAKDNNQPLYSCFIDASKAFDVVWHMSMMRRLFYTGIDGNDWTVINNMYQNLNSKVKWDGIVSRSFMEQQGVRQGGILSPELYKVFINPLLNHYRENGIGFKIGSIHIGSPTCADDIVLLSKSHQELQIMLSAQEHFAKEERYIISEAKTKAMIFNKKSTPDINEILFLHEKSVEKVTSYTHIGIERKPCSQEIVENRIKTARRTSYALMGAGMHGYNGNNPKISIKIWNTYVRPILVFGLDSIVLTKKEIKQVSQYHKSVLKTIQNLPERTADAAVYILCGQLPIESFIHSQILSKLGSILRNGGIEKEIGIRQLLMKNNFSNSWFIYAKNILDFYDFPSIFNLIDEIPSKLNWKKLVKEKVVSYWKQQVTLESKDKSSLKHLNSKPFEVNTVHNIWDNAGYDIISVMKATIKIKLVSGVYMLQSVRSKFSNKNISACCPLCGIEAEDKVHFILKCPELSKVREHFISELESVLSDVDVDVSERIVCNDELFTQLILDVTNPCIPLVLQTSETVFKIEAISRGLCFTLHKERCKKMEIAVG